MESYPTELLLGVFPLVFCVDATLSSKGAVGGGTGGIATGSSTGSTAYSPSQSPRSQFDRFLDTVAASLMDDPDTGRESVAPSPGSKQRTHDEVIRGLFRGEEGVVDSDHEDEIILSMDGGDGSEIHTKRTKSFSKNLKFPGMGRDLTGGVGGGSATGAVARNSAGGTDTSFAKALQEGQGFFQRARIVSISNRHGFPPSKDPTGEANRIREFFLGKTLRPEAVVSATKRRPIDGILPSGWLEKHAAALPSVILVVAQVGTHQQQHEQNTLLDETIKNIQISLASKRACTIHVVGLVQEGISTQMATAWRQEMTESLEGNPSVALLDVFDLQSDSSTSMTLRIFLKGIHDASLRYYTGQVRHTKQKLFELGQARNTPVLLPLAIRYCFKVAIFYEFRWRPEKALKYLVEAYRHVDTYFRYLLQQRAVGTENDTSVEAPTIRSSNHGTSISTGTESEAVEMSIQGEDDISKLLLNTPSVPTDMLLQCRVLADWLNFKIIQSCFTSHTEGGMMVASTQWRRHVQVFCNPRRSFICSPDHAFIDWSYVAHQRIVTCQLVERNPLRTKLGDELDETRLRFSPAKTYEEAAEALLRLGAEVKKAVTRNLSFEATVDVMRSRYVGGLDKNGYEPELQEALKVDHHDRALECLRRAILFHENNEVGELESTKYARARLHYLVGGILLGRQHYAEATPHLEKAALLTKGWSDLESKSRLLLVKAYKFYIPKVEPEQQLRLSSLLLGSYFEAGLSVPELQTVLSKFASSMNVDKILWSEDALDEDQNTLPISFALTFPYATHAQAGHTVRAILYIKSNLKYDVLIDAVDLFTSAGKIALQPSELRRSSEGSSDAGTTCLLKAMSTVSLGTSIVLPKDASTIAVDDFSGSSKPKIARPRTAGLTAAAGARLVNESEQEPLITKVRWSQKCLDGRPFFCDGLSMVFCLTGSMSSLPKKTRVELVVKKRNQPTPANVKPLQFEEENFLSSTWLRSLETPRDLGPRCLSVSAPQAGMTVLNLTQGCTGGKALEGTVNRILLKLTAGSAEECQNVSLTCSVSSFLVSATGDTTKIASESSDDTDTRVHPTNPKVRTPVLVRENSSSIQRVTSFGYETPIGWEPVVGGCHGEEHIHYSKLKETLSPGQHVFAVVDIFRPSPDLTTIEGTIQPGEDLEKLIYEHSMCQSNIEVSIQYQQKRMVLGSHPEQELDTVMISQSVAVVWTPPLSMAFSSTTKTSLPSGNRHPSNSSVRSVVDAESELVLIDGEWVTARCSLEAAGAQNGLFVDLDEVSFLDGVDEDAPCTFKLLSGKDPSGLLCKTSPQNPCRKLCMGSSFSVAWTSEIKIKSSYLKGSVSTSLGALSVKWSPCPMISPQDAIHSFRTHGPLLLESPSKCSLLGPPCYIENAPFEISIDGLPNHVQVATPFVIAYKITNKTAIDQRLKISTRDCNPDEMLCFMIAGWVDGEISLGPYEKITLTYTAVATMSGVHSVQPICVMSERYKTWLVQQSMVSGQKVFVSP